MLVVVVGASLAGDLRIPAIDGQHAHIAAVASRVRGATVDTSQPGGRQIASQARRL